MRRRSVEWGLVAALAAGAFAARLWALTRSAEPCGTDGYYYVVQAEHWIRTGALKVPDGSWVLRLCAVIARMVGDPVLGAKATGALLAALCVPAAWALGAGLGRETRAPAWALAIWAAASPSLTTLAAEFPKNLGAAAPLLVVAAVAVRLGGDPVARASPLETEAVVRPSRGAVALGVGLVAVLLAATAHRTGAVLWLPIALPFALASGRARLVLGAAGALLAFAALSVALPNLLHPADLPRVTEQLDWPGVRLPFAGRPRVEWVVSWVALVVAGIAWWRERRAVLWTLALPTLACVAPVWRGDTLDLGYRLALLAPLFGVPLLVAAAPRLALRDVLWPRAALFGVPPEVAAAPEVAVRRVPWSRAVVAAGVALAGLLFAAPAGFDASADPPYARYRRVMEAVPRPLPPLLIAHQGMSFLYTHLTGADAMAWAPEPELDRKEVGRVAWGIRPGEWLAWAPEPSPVPLDPEYAYVREDVWEAFVARAEAEGDDDLRERLRDWRNPSKVRPASLLRNRGR